MSNNLGNLWADTRTYAGMQIQQVVSARLPYARCDIARGPEPLNSAWRAKAEVTCRRLLEAQLRTFTRGQPVRSRESVGEGPLSARDSPSSHPGSEIKDRTAGRLECICCR